MTDRSQMLPVSAAVVRRIRKIRKDRRISALELADRMTRQGCPSSRNTIAQAEGGYRKEISVDWLWAASQSLGVPIKLLLHGPDCITCDDTPPPGYSCNACGKGSP